MSENISSNAIIYAILALDSEANLQREYLESNEVPENERDEEEGILADLEQSFMEFIDAYKARRKADNSLPSLEELLNQEI